VNRHAIGVRLATWNALFLVATFAVTGAGTWLAIRDSIYDTTDQELHRQLDSLAAQLAKAGGRPLAGNLAGVLAGSRLSGMMFQVGDQTHWVYQSPADWSWDPSPPGQQLTGSEQVRTITASGHSFRVLSATLPAGGTRWTVDVAQPLDEFLEILSQFRDTVLLSSPIVVLLAAAAGYLLSRRALDPVERITRTAQSIGPNNLAARLPLGGVDDELERLSKTVNGMLARLEDGFQRVTQFTADASHELRTPIAIIRTAAEVSQRQPRSEREYVETLDRILDESQRASRLIDDLLTLARADAGGDRTTFEHIDLAELLRDLCEQQRPAAQAAGLRFDAVIPAACPMIADRDRLRRLFLILIDNAIKYTASGGSVFVALSVDADRKAVTEIRDTGVGIDPNDLTHIFERFYRVRSDRSRETGGYGLGLSIARLIVAAHDGEMTVESQPNVGSVFRVILPVYSSSPSSDVLQNRKARSS
jgi:heavy metal sensor kinase